MLLNCINIEGIVEESNLKEICLNKCELCDYNSYINLNHNTGIKDIYQISLESSLKSNKFLSFKDDNILILKGITLVKILAVEDTSSNNIIFLEENVYFNFSFKRKVKELNNIEIFIIDAFFDIVNSNKIQCSLTYLFNFTDSNSREETIISLDTFSFIDITREFT